MRVLLIYFYLNLLTKIFDDPLREINENYYRFSRYNTRNDIKIVIAHIQNSDNRRKTHNRLIVWLVYSQLTSIVHIYTQLAHHFPKIILIIIILQTKMLF